MVSTSFPLFQLAPDSTPISLSIHKIFGLDLDIYEISSLIVGSLLQHPQIIAPLERQNRKQVWAELSQAQVKFEVVVEVVVVIVVVDTVLVVVH